METYTTANISKLLAEAGGDWNKMMETAQNNPEYVPWEWEEVICSCAIPSYALDPSISQGDKRCLDCGKIPRWQLLPCKNCGRQHIYWFKHHAVALGGWARHKRWCWNCIIEEDPAVEGDNPPVYTDPPRVAQFTDMSDFTIEF